MRTSLREKYRNDVLIPITFFNAPWWIRETILDICSQTVRRRRPITTSRLLRLLVPNTRNPVFVLGAPRSGTTFLGQCLSELPEVTYFFEPVFTKAAVRLVYTHGWSERKSAWIYRSVYSWLMRFRFEADLTFCEKTPGNCFIIPFLFRTFPNAKFIHIIRDGRDSAISLAEKPWYQNSMRGHDLRDPDGYRCGPEARFWVEPSRIDEYESTNDRHRCIWLWRRYVEEALKGSEVVTQRQMYEIRYEDLVSDPTNFATAILDFLEIEAQASRESFVDTVLRNARQDSIGRWKSALTEEEKVKLQSEAEELLETLGYSKG